MSGAQDEPMKLDEPMQGATSCGRACGDEVELSDLRSLLVEPCISHVGKAHVNIRKLCSSRRFLRGFQGQTPWELLSFGIFWASFEVEACRLRVRERPGRGAWEDARACRLKESKISAPEALHNCLTYTIYPIYLIREYVKYIEQK